MDQQVYVYSELKLINGDERKMIKVIRIRPEARRSNYGQIEVERKRNGGSNRWMWQNPRRNCG